MEVRATAKYIRMSPRKVKLIADAVRGRPVPEVLAALAMMPQSAAFAVAKAVMSAAANAENNYGLSPNELYVARVLANEGPTIKRWRPRAHGRVSPLLKRSSHITVVVEELEEKE